MNTQIDPYQWERIKILSDNPHALDDIAACGFAEVGLAFIALSLFLIGVFGVIYLFRNFAGVEMKWLK